MLGIPSRTVDGIVKECISNPNRPVVGNDGKTYKSRKQAKASGQSGKSSETGTEPESLDSIFEKIRTALGTEPADEMDRLCWYTHLVVKIANEAFEEEGAREELKRCIQDELFGDHPYDRDEE